MRMSPCGVPAEGERMRAAGDPTFGNRTIAGPRVIISSTPVTEPSIRARRLHFPGCCGPCAVRLRTPPVRRNVRSSYRSHWGERHLTEFLLELRRTRLRV